LVPSRLRRPHVKWRSGSICSRLRYAHSPAGGRGLPLVPSFEFPASGVWGGMAAARAAPESCQPVVRTLQPTPARAFRLPPSPLLLSFGASPLRSHYNYRQGTWFTACSFRREREMVRWGKREKMTVLQQRVVICFKVLMIYHYDQAAARGEPSGMQRRAATS
jgi:hypothetical protein